MLEDPLRLCPGKMPRSLRLARTVETALVRYPRILVVTHWVMIAVYLVLILVPPWLPKPPEAASPLSHFVTFSQFVIWSIWWPFVVLSTLGFGRAWCGLFCPEGALAAFASRFGGNRPIPEWMRWGGIPLTAFVGITIVGQVFEVDESPVAQLVILGGSTVAAILVGLIYSRRVWAWCRYLCPVSLLFGVFSRLGVMHFRVDQARLALASRQRYDARTKAPCPVQIHLPAMSTNRYCVMCFRCSGWRDAIHLDFRRPGKELLDINTAEPLFWEVIFLFGGAMGLPLGVFYGELRHVEGLWRIALLLGSTLLSVVVLSLLTALSTYLLLPSVTSVRERRNGFISIGYLYTPLSLFSLFLGLSQPTFSFLESNGLAHAATQGIRIGLLGLGVGWSLYIGRRILKSFTDEPRRVSLALGPHVVAVIVLLAAWASVF